MVPGRVGPPLAPRRALVASVGVAVPVCMGGLWDGVCVGLAVGRTGGLCSGWGSSPSCVGAAGRSLREDASGSVWGCGPELPAGPGPGPVCGRMVPGGYSRRALVVAVFLWLGMFPLPVAVAAWCCGRYRCAARLAASSCRGLCGVPAPDGAGARTLVAPDAAVVGGRGWVMMVATSWVEVEELWCRAPLAVIQVTAALMYVPSCGSRTSGWRARRTTGTSLWGGGYPLPR